MYEKIPKGYQKRKDILVCRYFNWFYGFFTLLCVFFSLFSFKLIWDKMLQKDEGYAYLLHPVTGVSAGFMVGAIVLFCIMKNKLVIFDQEGIYYRNLFGRVYRFSNDEIEGCMISSAYRHDYVVICTKKKSILMGVTAGNYYPAKKYVRKKYRVIR